MDISAPLSIINGEENISDDIKDSFASTNIIAWEDRILFPWLERPVSAMIYDINVNVKGNVVVVHPNYLYYMDIDTALNMKIRQVLYI